MAEPQTASFDSQLPAWVAAACQAWRATERWRGPDPGNDYLADLTRRLPVGLRALLAAGLDNDLIQPVEGWRFRINGLKKGPYKWFSLRPWHSGPEPKGPDPNWECFVHVAEFVRLHRAAKAHDLRIDFEDDRMDLTLYDGNDLLVYVEVKEQAAELSTLVQGVRLYGQKSDLTAMDGDDDGLKKAKYIAKHRPRYFCGVALGVRVEYRVDYQGQTFHLADDMIPWL